MGYRNMRRFTQPAFRGQISVFRAMNRQSLAPGQPIIQVNLLDRIRFPITGEGSHEFKIAG